MNWVQTDPFPPSFLCPEMLSFPNIPQLAYLVLSHSKSKETVSYLVSLSLPNQTYHRGYHHKPDVINHFLSLFRVEKIQAHLRPKDYLVCPCLGEIQYLINLEQTNFEVDKFVWPTNDVINISMAPAREKFPHPCKWIIS